MKLSDKDYQEVYDLFKQRIISLKKHIKEEEELIEIYKRYDTGSIQQKSSRKRAYQNHTSNREMYLKKYYTLQKLFNKLKDDEKEVNQ